MFISLQALAFGLCALNLIWTYLILVVAVRKLKSGVMKDSRSDQEEVIEDSINEDERHSHTNGNLLNNNHNNVEKTKNQIEIAKKLRKRTLGDGKDD